MPIFQKGTSGVIALNPQPFATERELETAIVETPNLLAEPNGPELAYVGQQISFQHAGMLDVLLVDSDGTPVAVEVKLGRNSESRREVVGQVIDYVSVLTSMTVDELDRAVGGAVERALRSLVRPEGAYDEFERLWATVGANLRAGLARYVIAIDDPSPDLQRIVGFLVARSSLRVSLTTIEKYVDPAGQIMFVPQHEVGRRESQGVLDAVSRQVPSSELKAVLDAYSALASPGFGTVGQAANFRQIRPAGWPRGLHYEFIKGRDAIGVEIHLESQPARALAESIRTFAGTATSGFPHRLEWDPAWTYGPRLFVKFASTDPPEKIALAMKQLIELTHQRISVAVRNSA